MARSSNTGPRGKHGRVPAPEEPNPFFQRPAREFPANPYSKFDQNDGPVPYANRQEEVARLRRKKKRNNKRPKIIIAVVLVLVVVFGISGAAFATSAMDAKDDAQALVSQASQLKSQVVSGDMASAKTTSEQMAKTASKLHDNTSSPLWAAATLIPFVGSDINTVRIVSDSAYVLTSDVLVPAMDVFPSNGLAGLMGSDGSINVQVIEDLLTVVSDSGPVLSEYATQLNAAPEPTIDQLKQPIAQVKDIMSALGPVADYATELKDTLPEMLGADGARNYLIIACSSAEMRSSVGFAGSFGVMTLNNGKISLGDFVGADQNPRLAESVSAATQEDINLFRWETSVDSRDVTQIIDFKRVGQIESQIWEANGHGKVDGVIAMDTVVLERMMALTGSSVTTPGGDVLDGSNTSNFLLNGVYKKYPQGSDQDMIFALVAATAADSVFGNIGKVNIAKLVNVLKNSFEEGRIAIYMANAQEEAMLEDFGLAGTVSSDPTVPETGIYMSACYGGKMYYYLTSDIDVSAGKKNADGSTTYDVRVEFYDGLTEAEVATLPNYVTNGHTNGSMQFLVYLLAPTDGKISDVSTEGLFVTPSEYVDHPFAITAGGDDKVNETTYQGNDLWHAWIHLAMGAKASISYKVTTAPNAEGDLVVRTTPLAGETEITYN
ncbi:DUF4012 domain-containing protein [Anaerotardibacter muris]|uniref:DUF4012 domain-containing protein n=1 Tax=Anaerotardibacter muris TaxID=2941505 RepID=UPI00203EF527|nr:DUF4012 domain-containing protein [Anaerotardibacter muris]